MELDMRKPEEPRDFARKLRKNLTETEQYVWQRLRNKQLNGHRFRRQLMMGSYVVDFVCCEKRLIVELDGGQHAENQEYDAARDEWLKSVGYRVLRFWNNQILEEWDAVQEVILKHLNSNDSREAC
jgi:very-short-patch-repair endonuclease